MPVDPASFDAIDVALKVASAVEAVGGEYFVGGSLASSLQGEPRATNDVDIVVSLPLGRLADFTASLGSEFEVDLDMLDAAYLDAWATRLRIEPLLVRARAEATPSS